VSKTLSQLDWRASAGRIILLTIGGLLYAVTVNLFFKPYQIAPSGVSGVAVILNSLIGTPVGLVILLGNIPIQILAYRMLGGWKIVVRTIYVVLLYSIAIDLLAPYFPARGITDDSLLSTIFGGILGGIAGGLIYRAGGTLGGTSTLARILQTRLGTSLNNTYLYTDSLVVLFAGLVFGWEGALYAMVAIFVDGATADYILEGPSTIRTVTIVTDHPREVADSILDSLGRGVTGWQGEGMYTEQPRSVLFVTIMRTEINDLKSLIFSVDPGAFIVIGQGHTAYGEGFQSIKSRGA
jgi:uncharacterized membrane-anchored protein YitT (DUF2179 family)